MKIRVFWQCDKYDDIVISGKNESSLRQTIIDGDVFKTSIGASPFPKDKLNCKIAINFSQAIKIEILEE